MYCTLEDIKSYCNGENKTIWLGDIILEFNPEYLID